jgi:hypothetical protein
VYLSNGAVMMGIAQSPFGFVPQTFR